MVNKPFTVARQELGMAIAKAVNGSTIPAIIKIDVLNEAVTALRSIANEEYYRDLEAYNNAVKEEENKTKRDEINARKKVRDKQPEVYEIPLEND